MADDTKDKAPAEVKEAGKTAEVNRADPTSPEARGTAAAPVVNRTATGPSAGEITRASAPLTQNLGEIRSIPDAIVTQNVEALPGGYTPVVDLADDELPPDPVAADKHLRAVIDRTVVVDNTDRINDRGIGLVLTPRVPTAFVAKQEAKARPGHPVEDVNRVPPNEDRIEQARARQRARHKLFLREAEDSNVDVAVTA